MMKSHLKKGRLAMTGEYILALIPFSCLKF
jgi:hypothetical protein